VLPHTDSLPPSLQAELQQLRDMGFTDATRNVRALLAAGGYALLLFLSFFPYFETDIPAPCRYVESAIAWLFENP
jgi:hypothetical protein